MSALASLLIAVCSAGAQAIEKGRWTAVGPAGGTVLAMDFDPSNPRRILAGTYFGGVYESTDQGASWKHVDTEFGAYSVFSIAFDVRRPRTVYAGTFQGGIYKSADGGATWRQSNTGLTDFSIQAISVNIQQTDVLLAVAGTTLFRSADAGATWTRVTQGLDKVQSRSVLFDTRQGNIAWMGTYGKGVYRSTDGGISWERFSDGMGDQTINSLAMSPLQNRRLYAASSQGAAFKLLGESRVWTAIPVWPDGPRGPVYHIYPHPATLNVLFAATAEGLHVSLNDGASWKLTLKKEMGFTKSDYLGTSFFAAGLGNGLFVTRNLGEAWAESTAGMQNVFVGTLAAGTDGTTSTIHAGTEYGIFSAVTKDLKWSSPTLKRRVFTVLTAPGDLQTVYTGTEQFGVWKSTDSARTWNRSTEGIVPNRIYAIEPSRSNPALVYAGTSSGMYVSADGGETWNPGSAVDFPKILSIAVDPRRSLTAYFGGLGGIVLKTTTAGASYEFAYNGLPQHNIIALRVSPRDDNRVLAIASNGHVYLTEDGGKSWNAIRAEPADAICVDIDPGRPWVFYLGTAGGGVVKSDTGGIEWERKSEGMSSPFVFSVAVDPKNPDVVWAASTDGVYKSLDGAESWTRVSAGLPSGFVQRIVVDPNHTDTVYASITDHGIYRSLDGGESWSEFNTGLPVKGTQAIAVDPLLNSKVYAGSELKGFYTSDGTADWSPANHDLSLFVRGLAIAPSDRNILYAGTLTGGVFKSTDGGENWSNTGQRDRLIFNVKVNPKDARIAYAGTSEGVSRTTDGGETWSSLGQKISFVFCLGVDPENRQILFAGGNAGSLVRSSDGGRSWSSANSGLPARNVLSILVTEQAVFAALEDSGIYRSADQGETWELTQFGGSGNLKATGLSWDKGTGAMYAATNGQGVLVSFDGRAWAQFNDGLPTTIVTAVQGSRTQPGTVFVVTADEGLFRSVAGKPWERIAADIRAERVLGVTSDATGALLLSTSAGLFRSIDEGLTWTRVGPEPAELTFETITAAPSNERKLYALDRSRGIFSSVDGGLKWQLVLEVPAGAPIRNVVLGVDDNTVHAGTLGRGIVTTRDGGESWSDAASPETVNPFVLSLAIDPVETGTVYAGTSAGILKSTDSGVNWRPASQGLSNTSVLTLVIDPAETSTLYAGTGEGVFISRDSGDSWQKLERGMFHKNITSLAVDASNHKVIYAGTEGAGVFRYEHP